MLFFPVDAYATVRKSRPTVPGFDGGRGIVRESLYCGRRHRPGRASGWVRAARLVFDGQKDYTIREGSWAICRLGIGAFRCARGHGLGEPSAGTG